MLEITRIEADKLLSMNGLSKHEANWLNREIYSSRGIGAIMISNVARFERIKKRLTNPCQRCGQRFYADELFLTHVDESNEAITNNSPILCVKCATPNERED